MSKKALNLSAIVLATTLTGCSSFMSGIGQSGWLNDGHQMPSDVHDQTTAEKRNQVSDAYGPLLIPADTVAMRLKEKFGFVSDGDVAAARNSYFPDHVNSGVTATHSLRIDCLSLSR